MDKIDRSGSVRVTLGDPKDYPNWKSAKETNTPINPKSTDISAGKANK
ncbi:hypothetical protein [Dendrosporobacter sp. 1207_IL3150]